MLERINLVYFRFNQSKESQETYRQTNKKLTIKSKTNKKS